MTKERSKSYQRPLQAKRVQTIAQTTALTPKRPNRATSAPRAFPSIFPPESVKTVSRRAPIIWRSRDEAGRHRCVGRRITQNFGGARWRSAAGHAAKAGTNSYPAGLVACSTPRQCGQHALTVPRTWMTAPSVIIPRSPNKLKKAKQLSGGASASNKSRFMAKCVCLWFAA